MFGRRGLGSTRVHLKAPTAGGGAGGEPPLQGLLMLPGAGFRSPCDIAGSPVTPCGLPGLPGNKSSGHRESRVYRVSVPRGFPGVNSSHSAGAAPSQELWWEVGRALLEAPLSLGSPEKLNC